MADSQAIGVRLNSKELGRIDSFGREERLDRSTAMRALMEEGYSSYSKKKAAQDYVTGRMTMSKAAEKAGFTIWEMEQYLVNNGFRSQYSVQDLKEETAKANNIKQRKTAIR